MVKHSIPVIYLDTKGEVGPVFCSNQWSCTEVTLGLYFHVHSYCEIVLLNLVVNSVIDLFQEVTWVICDCQSYIWV